MFDNMFGFILKQPMHKTIRQLRVVTILLLLMSRDIMYRLLGILERNSELSSGETMAVVGTLTAAVFATIWKGISNMAEPHKDDD